MTESPATNEIQLNVRGPGEAKLRVTVTTDQTVLDLKHKIAEQSDIEASRQKLIYSGRVLKNDDVLSAYKIQSAHTIHMVKGGAPPPQPAAAPQTAALPFAEPFHAAPGLVWRQVPPLGTSSIDPAARVDPLDGCPFDPEIIRLDMQLNGRTSASLYSGGGTQTDGQPRPLREYEVHLQREQAPQPTTVISVIRLPPVPVAGRPEERFQVQLQQLQDMGFVNAIQNVRALLATGGNVPGAIEYILAGGGA